MIRTHALTKRFGKVLAVDSIDLDVRQGDIYGFLGANGSGKTTTVRMILGLVLATSGSIELMRRPMPRSAHRVLPSVGTLIEGPAAYGHLSARANLAILDASGSGSRTGRPSRSRRIAGVLEQVGLAGIGNRPVRAYSLGMRQRLGLAAALLRRPELLILDEPTNGLDPQGIREIRELLVRLNSEGTTVFLSSHLLAEIEQMCTRVGALDRGRLVVQDDLDALRGPTGRTIIDTPDPDAAIALLDGRVEARNGARLIVRGESPAALNAMLVARGLAVRELTPERRSLEDVILERTSHGSDRVMPA
ncbi:MAG: ABC transporter ATP-binding protein [Actinomycetota bacterium]|nr:ABC transporter ATP-binding protein [Actinomycetota bacterium]